MAKRILFLILFSLSLQIIQLNAQVRDDEKDKDQHLIDYTAYIPNVSLTPEASALHRFIDVPVGYFTGSLDLNIPLLVIDLPDFTLPISISYHSLGIKGDQIATSVGTGWSLQAGGMISRTIRGFGDNTSGGYLTGNLLPTPYLGFEPLDYDALIRISGASREPSRPTLDAEPDFFYYNYPGGSGKYVIDRTGRVNHIPKRNILIDGSVITDENGTIFKFHQSGGTISEDYIAPDPRLIRPVANITKYLTEIVTTSGNSIHFEYEIDQYSYEYETMTRYKRISPPGCGPVKPINPYIGKILVEVMEPRLKRIYSNNGHVVDFIYDSYRQDLPEMSGKELKKIIFSFFDEPLKEIVFHHKYSEAFDSQASFPFKNKRLFLDSIVISEEQVYSFDYYNLHDVFSLNSFSQDFYGFNNGMPNSTLCPPFPGEAEGADRSHNIDFLKAGVLKSVTYPTGGKSIIDYEPNQGAQPSRYIGGLRVKSITEVDHDDQFLKERFFNYNIPGTYKSSGIENTFPLYVETEIVHTPAPLTNCELCTYIRLQSKSHTGAGLNGVQGGNVFYEYVTELNGKYGEGGKKEFKYTAYRDIGNGAIKPYIPVRDYSWARGKLLQKTSFSWDGESFHVVGMERFAYHYSHGFKLSHSYSDDQLEHFIGGVVVEVIYPECVEEDNMTIRRAELRQHSYSHISSWVYPRMREIRQYKDNTPESKIDDSDYFTTHKELYEYSPVHLQLSSVLTYGSQLDTLVIDYKYPPDFPISQGSLINDYYSEAIQLLNYRNIISNPIEVVSKIKLGDEYFITGGSLLLIIRNEYDQLKPAEYKKLMLDELMPVNQFEASKVENGLFKYDSNYRPEIHFKRFDSKGNLQHYLKEDDVENSFLWGFLSSVPLISGANISIEELETAVYSVLHGFPQYNMDLSDFFGNLDLNSPDSREALQTFITALKANLPADAMIQVFTHKPHVGITSQTDTNGLTTYYEYDGLGRLIRVRDHEWKLVQEIDYHYANQ